MPTAAIDPSLPGPTVFVVDGACGTGARRLGRFAAPGATAGCSDRDARRCLSGPRQPGDLAAFALFQSTDGSRPGTAQGFNVGAGCA